MCGSNTLHLWVQSLSYVWVRQHAMNQQEHVLAQLRDIHSIISRMRAHAADYGLECKGRAYNLATKLLAYYQDKKRPGIVWRILGPLSLLREYEGPHELVCRNTCQYEVVEGDECVGLAVRCYKTSDKPLDRKSVWSFVPTTSWKVGRVDASSLVELQNLVQSKAKLTEDTEA